MRPTTVAPSRMAAGGLLKADSDPKGSGYGVGLRIDLPDSPSRCHGRIVGQRHNDRWVVRSRTQHLGRHVEHCVPPFLTSYSKDHLSCLHHLAGLSSPGYDGAGGVRLELCVAHPIFGNLQSGFGVFNLRLRGLDSSLGLVEQDLGRIFSRQERLFAREVIAGFPQPSLRRNQSGLSRTQSV